MSINPLDPESGVVRMDSIAHLILSIGELRRDVGTLREEVEQLRKRVNDAAYNQAIENR